LEKLNDELELLSTAKRRRSRTDQGGTRVRGYRENAEYDDAKNEQAMVESRIAQLEERLRMATVIETKDLSTDMVQVGSVVHVKDEKTGKSVKYTIVGSAEAKPRRTSSPTSHRWTRAVGHKRNTLLPEGSARSSAQAEDHEDRRRSSSRLAAMSGTINLAPMTWRRSA